jgi:hypothetical protein
MSMGNVSLCDDITALRDKKPEIFEEIRLAVVGQDSYKPQIDTSSKLARLRGCDLESDPE